MVDAPVTEQTPVAPAAEPAAPVADVSRETSPAAVEQAPVAVETPETGGSILSDAKAGEPAPETPAVAEPAANPTDAPAEPNAEAKPAEAPAQDPAQPAPLPTYVELTLPEGVQLDKAKVSEFDQKLGKFQAARNLSTEDMQALRQELADFYIKDQQEATARVQQMQHDVWERTRDQWKEDFRKDPEMGGNKEQTTIRQAGAAMERFGQVMGSQAEADLRMALRVTGAGDHPAIIRFVQWASRYNTEQAKPVPATVPKAPNTNTRAAKRYGGNQGA